MFVIALVAMVACSSGEVEFATVDNGPVFESGLGDGALDCLNGLIPRTQSVDADAPAESQVVKSALRPWIDSGAELLPLPAQESWAAVIDGREVAIAYPEQEGDGGWVVTNLAVCGEPDIGPADIDGRMDCPSDAGWGQTGSIDPDAVGEATAELAIRLSLRRYADRLGGTITMTGQANGSLVIEQREIVVASALQTSGGGWVVDSVAGCEHAGP